MAAPTLLAGFGVSDITPAGPVRLSGFAARTAPSVGVHDRLAARAMAIAEPGSGTTLLLLCLDVIGVSADLTRRVREALRSRYQSVYPATGRPTELHVAVLATHTHGAPAVLPDAFLGPVEPATLELVFGGAVAAGLAALGDLAPAELGFATEPVPGLAHNRRNASGPVDEQLSVVAAWRPGAVEPCGALIAFSLHPVVLGADNLQLTRDYPGYLSDALTREVPGCLALFACGCAGDVNQGHAAEASWTTQGAPARTFAKAESIGERLAGAAATALLAARALAPLPVTLAVAQTTVGLPLQAPPDAPALLGRFSAAAASARAEGDPGRAALNDDLVAWAAAQADRGGAEATEVELQVFRLGDLALVFLPGEPFVAYGLRLKELGGGRVLPLAYANAAPGYLPTAAAFALGGYEVDLAYMFYGATAAFTSQVEEVVIEAARGLLLST